VSKTKGAEVPEATAQRVYSRLQILGSTRFTPQEKDVLAAALAEGRDYTIEEAAQAAAEFRTRKVTN
jgi:hypothetical protein